MPAPNNPLINDLTKRDQYLSQLASLQKPQLPAQAYGYQNMVMREPPHNGLVSVQAPPPQAPQAQAPQAQKPKASFQPKKAFSRSVDTQQQRAMAQVAYESELKGYESQISQGYPVDPLSRRRTAERYRNEIARLDAIDNATLREDYGNRERARKASNASVIDEMAGQALDESSAAFAKSTPSAPVVKRNPDGTPTTADPYQYGSLSPNRPDWLDRGQGPFTPGPPGPSSSPVPPRQSIDSILDGLRQFQGQSTPETPFVQAVKEAVAKSTTGQLGALAAPTPIVSRQAPTQADIDNLNIRMRPQEMSRPAPSQAPPQELDPLSDFLGTGLRPYQPVQNTNPTLMQEAPTLDPAFLEQMRQQGTVPQRVLTPEELGQGTPRGVGEQLFRSSIGVGGLLGPPMPSDYDTNPTTVAEANELAVDKFGAEMNAGIQGMAGAAAGGNLMANRKPAPGSGMRPAATVQEGPVVQGQTNPRVKATLGRTGPLQYEVTPGQEGKVVDRPNVPYPDPRQLPKSMAPDPTAQALENLTRTNTQNEAARRRTVKAADDMKFAKQDANSVAEREAQAEAQSAFGKAQDRKEAVRVQAAKDKDNFEKNPVNPKTGEKEFPTDADGAPVLTTEQLAKRSGIKGGTPEAVSQALADKQANKKALVEAANKGDIDAVDKLLAESKAIDARARAAEENSKTVLDKAGAQEASDARDLAGRVALARQRAGLTFDKSALPLEGATTRKPAKAAPAPEPEPQTGIEVLAKPTTGEPIARTQPTAPSEAKDAKRKRPVDLPAPVEQRAKALKQAPKVVEAPPAGAKKVENTSTPSKPTPKAKTSEDLDKEIAAAIKKSGDTDEQIAAHMRGAGLTDEGFIAKEIKRFRDMNKEPEPVSPPAPAVPAAAPAAPKTNAQQVAEDMKKGLEGIGAGAGVAFKSDTAKRLSKALDGRMTFEQVIADMGVEIGGQTGRESRLVFDLARQRGLKSVDGETFTSLLKEALGRPAPPVPSDRPTIPVVPEAKPRVETPVKPTPRGAVQKAIAAITGQDKKPISTPEDQPKTVAPKDETADRVKRAKRLRAQTDRIAKGAPKPPTDPKKK